MYRACIPAESVKRRKNLHCYLVCFMYKGAHLSTPKWVDKDVLPNDCDQTASMSATGLKPPRGCGG